MARSALVRESRRLMIRICCAVVICGMATVAIGRGAVEDTIEMALRASRGEMLTGQSKVGRAVIKRRRRPAGGRVTLRAAVGELG